MSTKFRNNVIWIDFKNKRILDVKKNSEEKKYLQTIPYLCIPKKEDCHGYSEI